MAFDSTITENDLDANPGSSCRDQRGDAGDFEPDLAVDGLSESILSRILGLFGVGAPSITRTYRATFRTRHWPVFLHFGFTSGLAAMDNESPREIEAFRYVGRQTDIRKPAVLLPACGRISLGASMYLNYWYWPTICFVRGSCAWSPASSCLLKRRDHRVNDRRAGQRQDY